MALELVTAPTEEPISRAEAKAQLRLDTSQAELAPQPTLTYQNFSGTSNGTGVAISGYKATAIVNCGTIASGDDLTLKLQESADNITYTNVSTTDTWTDVDSDADVTVFDENSSSRTYRQVYNGTRPYVRVAITAVTDGGTLEAWITLQSLVTDENDLIDGLITAARMAAENYLDKKFVTQAWDWKFNQFPSVWDASYEAKLPLCPLQSLEVWYRATLGSTTYSSAGSSLFILSTPRKTKGRLQLVSGQSWPEAADMMESVRLRLTCGYGAASAVPKPIKAALKLMTAMLFTDRSAGSDKLLTPRVRDLLDTERHNL